MTKTCACWELWFEVTIAYCVALAAVMAVTYAVGPADRGLRFYARVRVHLHDPETKAEAFVFEALVKSGQA